MFGAMRQWASSKPEQIQAVVILCSALITLEESVCNLTPEGGQPTIDISRSNITGKTDKLYFSDIFTAIILRIKLRGVTS